MCTLHPYLPVLSLHDSANDSGHSFRISFFRPASQVEPRVKERELGVVTQSDQRSTITPFDPDELQRRVIASTSGRHKRLP